MNENIDYESNRAYQKCLKLYPEAHKALLLGASYPDLIKGFTTNY